MSLYIFNYTHITLKKTIQNSGDFKYIYFIAVLPVTVCKET